MVILVECPINCHVAEGTNFITIMTFESKNDLKFLEYIEWPENYLQNFKVLTLISKYMHCMTPRRDIYHGMIRSTG